VFAFASVCFEWCISCIIDNGELTSASKSGKQFHENTIPKKGFCW